MAAFSALADRLGEDVRHDPRDAHLGRRLRPPPIRRAPIDGLELLPLWPTGILGQPLTFANLYTDLDASGDDKIAANIDLDGDDDDGHRGEDTEIGRGAPSRP